MSTTNTGLTREEQIEAAWNEHRAVSGRGPTRRDWLKQRRAEQGERCFYCHVAFDDGETDPLRKATVDHQVPLSRGGEDRLENCVAACALCNKAKGSMMPDEVETLLPSARAELMNGRVKPYSWNPRRL